MKPCYSIIVPVYKVEPYLRTCLDSLTAQTLTDFELILIDDSSPDNCPAICDEYAARDKRITVIHKANEGVCAARWAGLQRASCEYVCFVDSDDYVASDWLARIDAALTDAGRPDMLMYGIQHVSPEKQWFAPPRLAPGVYDKARLTAEVYPHMLYDPGGPFLTKSIAGFLWNKVTRRTLLMQHYLSDRRIHIYEDSSMIFECVYNADSLCVVSDCGHFYRTNPQSALQRYQPDFIENLQYVNEYMKSHLGAQAPDQMTAINAYVALRVIDALAQELRHGQGIFKSSARVRREMNRTGLARSIDTQGLPLYIRLFITMLKCRCYLAAVLVTKLRMNGSAGSDN